MHLTSIIKIPVILWWFLLNLPSSLLHSGAFVVLKTDFQNGGDPPIWKIDAKALLQKYVTFKQDVKTLYRNTSTVSIHCSWDKTYLYQGHRLCDWMLLDTAPLWPLYSCLRLTVAKTVSPQASVFVLRYLSTGTTSLLDLMWIAWNCGCM